MRERITGFEARRKGVCVERVLGIGGVFFKARDPKALAAWYREHLGVAVEPEQTYGTFTSTAAREKEAGGIGSYSSSALRTTPNALVEYDHCHPEDVNRATGRSEVSKRSVEEMGIH